MVSWRNPTAEHRDWGLADYIEALEDALDATCEISGSADVAAVGACAGGITLTTPLGYMAATRPRASGRIADVDGQRARLASRRFGRRDSS